MVFGEAEKWESKIVCGAAGGASKENIRKNVNVLLVSSSNFTWNWNILYYKFTNMAVCSDIFLFILCLLIVGALVFVLIYFIITLSDLECDYLNAQECCAKLNFVSCKISIMIYELFLLVLKKLFF